MFDPEFYLNTVNSAYASELQPIRLLARPSGRDDHVVLKAARHLKIAGRIACFTISAGYQPPLTTVATRPSMVWQTGERTRWPRFIGQP